jgi:hypothetical protein
MKGEGCQGRWTNVIGPSDSPQFLTLERGDVHHTDRLSERAPWSV